MKTHYLSFTAWVCKGTEKKIKKYSMFKALTHTSQHFPHDICTQIALYIITKNNLMKMQLYMSSKRLDFQINDHTKKIMKNKLYNEKLII